MPAILPGLSDDLWAKIIVELEGRFTDCLRFRVNEPVSLAKAQSSFHQLRLVCHKFNDVFKDHPKLSRCLALSPALTQQSLPGLLAWLQQYRASVEIFAACGSPCMEAALSKLMPPQTSLDTVFLSFCSSSAVQLMSGLTSLTHCEIVSPRDTVLLTPLKDLVNLQKLHLTDGQFAASGLPAHLTNLTIEGANLFISQSTLGSSCVTSLRKLRVCDGELSGLHPRGLLACSIVEHLQLEGCLIAADELEQRVDFTRDHSKVVCMPTGISELTSLSSLTLSLGLDTPGVRFFDLGPLHALNLLQDLCVLFEGPNMRMRLSAELSALQKLTSLYLSAHRRTEYDEDIPSDRAVAKLHVDWSGMHALQRLTIRNWHFTCTSSMLELTALRNLSLVDFDNSRPVEMEDEQSSFKWFSLMVYQLARHCPHVVLKIDEEKTA